MAKFTGTNAQDNVVGSTFDDVIAGAGGDDVLSGGGGGTDRLEGGLGNDTFYAVDYYGDTFVEHAGEGVDTMIWTTGHSYALPEHIEILRLTNGETGTGNAEANSIYGNDHANRLFGGAGNDIIVAGQGDDQLDGEAGDDALHGGDGDDTYTVHDGTDLAIEHAGEGVDTVRVVETNGAFASTPYVLADNVENLTWDMVVTGSFYTRNMVGNALDNIIRDQAYGSTIKGLGGADQLYGDYMEDRLEGGAGDDYLVGGAHADTLNGGGGADVFVADAYMGADVVEDFTIGADKIGLLDGMTIKEIVQEGEDARVVFEPVYAMGESMLLKRVNAADIDIARDFVIDAEPVAPRLSTRSNAADQTLTGDAGFNYLRGDWGNDLISGLGGDDDLFGNRGHDTLLGGTGADNLDGEMGADRMEGGAGNDVYLVRDTGDAVLESLGDGVDEVRTYLDNYVLAANVERLDLTFGQAVTGTGNEADNHVQGNNEDNNLFGLGGADELHGGEGADVLRGGDGNDRLDGGLDGPGSSETGYKNIGDTLVGGAGADRFIAGYRYENGFEASGADIVMDFTDGKDLIEAWGVLGWRDIQAIVHDDGTEDTLVVFDDEQYYDATLLLKGVSAEQITAEDFIFGHDGTSFADRMVGTANNDMLDAGSGSDLLDGGAGSDQMLGGAGNDTLIARSGEDRLLGGVGADRLLGRAGDDRLVGGWGGDTLVGGTGGDVLKGGTGADSFVFNSIAEGGDTIVDFDALAGDVINLSAIDADARVSGDQAFFFVNQFSGVAGEAVLSFDPAAGLTLLQLDLDGDQSADFDLMLMGHTTTDSGAWVL